MITNSKINRIKLAKCPEELEKIKITNSTESSNFARCFYDDDLEIYESMFLILLDRSNNTIGWCKISQGGVTGTIIDIKIIVKYALDALACSIILFHNHPSGNINPSTQDIEYTNRLKSCLKLFDINFLDHVILTKNLFFSFADEALL